MKNILKTGFFLASLLVGIILFIIFIGLMVLMVYVIYTGIKDELSHITFYFSDALIYVLMIGGVIGIYLSIAYSPNLIKWSWRKLKNK